LTKYCNGVINSNDHGFLPALLSHQGTGLTTINLKYHIGNVRQGTGWDRARYKGLIGEIIICPTEHDDITRQMVEGYLAHKWGLEGELPGAHPYKNDPPYPPGLGGTVFRFR
jgi:hypothetical protein